MFFGRIFLVSLVASIVLTSCKTRDFNSNPRHTISNPVAPKTPCHETLQRNAPYTPEVLIQQLTTALNLAASNKIFEKENFRDFLFADEVEVALRGALKPDLFLGDDCSLTRAINESLKKPSHFYWLTGNGLTSFGGMALYKGDVYAEGFYRNRGAGVGGTIYPRRKYNFDELMTKQPWFEWSSQEQKFKPHLGTPGVRLVTHMNVEQKSNALTLYRGTNVKYADKLSALASMNSFVFAPNVGGIFSTPSYEAAKGWSSPVVLTSRISAKNVLEALENRKEEPKNAARVYMGIEFGYVEVAFLYSPGDKNNLFFDNIVSQCVVPDKAQGADSAFAEPCK